MSKGGSVSPRVVKSIAQFVVAHGGFATAVIEHLGRSGARIVIVADDGTWGDQVVPSVPAAQAACAAAKIDVADGWMRELSALISAKPPQ